MTTPATINAWEILRAGGYRSIAVALPGQDADDALLTTVDNVLSGDDRLVLIVPSPDIAHVGDAGSAHRPVVAFSFERVALEHSKRAEFTQVCSLGAPLRAGDDAGAFPPGSVVDLRLWLLDFQEKPFLSPGSPQFTTYRVADISTSHITAADSELLASLPEHLGELGSPQDVRGSLLHLPVESSDREARFVEYLDFGMSHEFVAIIRHLTAQEIPYVRFDRDGATVEGLPTFEW